MNNSVLKKTAAIFAKTPLLTAKKIRVTLGLLRDYSDLTPTVGGHTIEDRLREAEQHSVNYSAREEKRGSPPLPISAMKKPPLFRSEEKLFSKDGV
ncbi:MAG: hypothetical protein ACLTD8_04025 [Acutalibacteraceae bacterium]